MFIGYRRGRCFKGQQSQVTVRKCVYIRRVRRRIFLSFTEAKFLGKLLFDEYRGFCCRRIHWTGL